MDHYRLLSLACTDEEQQKAPQSICRGRAYIWKVIDCAYPPIPETSEKLFELVEERGEKMFFSQKQLRNNFNDEVIHDLLTCQCSQCKDARDGDIAGELLEDVKNMHAWLLFPIMVYLGKLHFVYQWLSAIDIRSINDSTKSHAPVHCDDVANLERLIPNDIERMLFRSAYKHTLRMFNPFVFEIFRSGVIPHRNLVPHARFPYEEEDQLVNTASATVTYFEVPAEYVHVSVRERMKLYPGSIRKDGKQVFRFVRKVLKLAKSEDKSEKDVLRHVSQIKEDAADNIITLLALYNWRHHIHYVFPFVESDLHCVLREGHFSREIPSSNDPQRPLSLPGQWLWDQIVGVAHALSAIHYGITNPHLGDTGQVIAFHFDLRPKNILVTREKKLKITDFGQSVMRVVEPGEELSEQFTSGDMKYFAPESWLDPKEVLRNSDGELREKEVLLNYDVWSLACVKLEVLIFLMEDRETSLAQFDLERLAEQPPLPFFGSGDVKECVTDKIDNIIHRFTKANPGTDEIHDIYLHSICKLLKMMFAYDKDKRIYSSEVKDRLLQAGRDYHLAREREENKLRTAIKSKEVEENETFRELGWRDKDEALCSFLDMDEVTITQRDRSNTSGQIQDGCHFQLLYRPEREVHPEPTAASTLKSRAKPKIEPAQFALKWAFELPNGEPSNIDTTLSRELQPSTRELLVPDMRAVDTSQTQLIPTYIFEDNGADTFECSLFDGLRKKIVLTIGFKSKRDAQAFQGALLHHRVFPGAPAQDIIPNEIIWTNSRKREFKTTKPRIQFWMKSAPQYLHSRQDRARPPSLPEACAALAVFGSYEKLMLVALNTGSKQISCSGTTITILPHRGNGVKVFYVAPTPLKVPWSEARFEAPTIPLEQDTLAMSDQELKIKCATISLSRSSHVRLFEQHVGREWVR